MINKIMLILGYRIQWTLWKDDRTIKITAPYAIGSKELSDTWLEVRNLTENGWWGYFESRAGVFKL